jgi:hypothetical protein
MPVIYFFTQNQAGSFWRDLAGRRTPKDIGHYGRVDSMVLLLLLVKNSTGYL